VIELLNLGFSPVVCGDDDPFLQFACISGLGVCLLERDGRELGTDGSDNLEFLRSNSTTAVGHSCTVTCPNDDSAAASGRRKKGDDRFGD
jgi:hypothetical protein